jgi:hypothetical protein
MMELCMLVWAAVIVALAWFTGFPGNVPYWFWVVGMAACAPVVATIGARRDDKTTIFREFIYFFRPGFAVVRMVFWPVTILVACFGSSLRKGLIESTFNELYNKHGRNGMRGDTAHNIAMAQVRDFDRRCDVIEAGATCVAEGARELPAVACRTTVLAATLAATSGTVMCAAQDHNPAHAPTTSVLLVRTGQNLQAPFTGTYHLAELFQMRGKWIVPDMGYVDFAKDNYRELFAGGGWTFVNRKKVTLTGEGFFVQDTGPNAKGARYLWANPILNVHFTPKWTWQTGYLSYFPLNHSGTFQQVLERSKVEHPVASFMKLGAGYGMYETPRSPVQNKPFVTATFATRAGSLELWCEHMPKGAQVQARYVFAHTGH